MKSTIATVTFVGMLVGLFLLAVGVTMIVVGAIGNIFDIEAYKLLSFWEIALLGLIFTLLGWGSK